MNCMEQIEIDFKAHFDKKVQDCSNEFTGWECQNPARGLEDLVNLGGFREVLVRVHLS